MEEESLKWLMGDVPLNPYRSKHRPYEEMSESDETYAEDGRENGESVTNGIIGEERHNDINGVDDEYDENGSRVISIPKVLPGCTKGRDHKMPWQMSIYHMQAYMMMKGPGGPDEDDPMLLWIAEQDKKKARKAAEAGEISVDLNAEKKPAKKGMFAGAKDSMKMEFDWKIQGPAKYDEEQEGERLTSFKYPRPKIDHIKVPNLLNPEYLEEMYRKHKEAGGGWSEFVNDYCSDDENDSENGRISPCTFARWAEGCKRWDKSGDKFKSVMEELQHYDIPTERQRPKSPNSDKPRSRKYRSKEAQVDERDGVAMSPACSEYQDTEPSILWSPAPISPTLPEAIQKDQMYRMDPELAIALREGHKDAILGSADSFGLDETNEEAAAAETQNIHPNEVQAVVAKYWDATQTFQTIEQKQRDLEYLAQNEALVNSANDRYRHDAVALKHENRKLADCLVQLRRNRDMRIIKDVDGRMRELEYEHTVRAAELEAQYRENSLLRREYDHEKSVQRRLLAEFGKARADEVFEMYPAVWEPLEKRKNYRNYS